MTTLVEDEIRIFERTGTAFFIAVKTVTAAQLTRAYDKNEIAADTAWQGKTVKLEGRVQSIGRNGGTAQVNLEGHDVFKFVTAKFNKGNDSPLADLQIGEPVAFVCTVTGKLVFAVHAEDCYTAHDFAVRETNKAQKDVQRFLNGGYVQEMNTKKLAALVVFLGKTLPDSTMCGKNLDKCIAEVDAVFRDPASLVKVEEIRKEIGVQ